MIIGPIIMIPVSLGGWSSVSIGMLLAKKSMIVAKISGFKTDQSVSSSD